MYKCFCALLPDSGRKGPAFPIFRIILQGIATPEP